MSETFTEAQAHRLLTWLQVTAALEAKSNAELAALLVDHLWADVPLGSPQSDLLAEVIARLTGDDTHQEDTP